MLLSLPVWPPFGYREMLLAYFVGGIAVGVLLAIALPRVRPSAESGVRPVAVLAIVGVLAALLLLPYVPRALRGMVTATPTAVPAVGQPPYPGPPPAGAGYPSPPVGRSGSGPGQPAYPDPWRSPYPGAGGGRPAAYP